MAINDVLPQIDPVPGLSNDRRQDQPAFVTDAGSTDSAYQRALSRNLNDRGKNEPPAADRTPAPENSSRPTADERPSPQQTEEPRATRSTEDTSEASRQEQTPQSDTATGNERTDVNEAEVAAPETNSENSDSAADAVNAAAVVISIQPPPAEIATGDYQEPKPPSDLSSLFATSTADEQIAVDAATVGVETVRDESLRPPNGLFETPEIANQQEQRNSTVQQADDAPTTASVVVDTAAVDQIPSSADQPETTAVANTIEVDQSTVTVDSRPQNNELAQPSGAEIVATNGATGSEQPAASAASLADETPDITDVNSTPANSAVAANLAAGERIQSNRQTLDDDTRLNRTDQDNSTTAADATVSSHPESVTTPQASSARQNELVGDGGSGQRTDLESRSETTSESDTSRSSVTAVRGDTGRTTIPVQGTQSSPSVSGTPLVDPEQLVERVAAGIRAAPPNGQQLRVKLYPPHLGQLQIEVNSNGGTVSVRMEVQNVAAQNALNDNLSLLREALVQLGTSLDRIDVQLVETHAEEGRSDLTDEQQQQSQRESDDDQPDHNGEEQATGEESEQDQQPVAAALNMDELDIQV